MLSASFAGILADNMRLPGTAVATRRQSVMENWTVPRSRPIDSALGQNALPLQGKAFDITFDNTAATILPLDGRPWRADVISAWHPVSVAMPTNMSPPIALLATNTRRTPKIGMG